MSAISPAALLHGAMPPLLMAVLDWVGTLAFALSGAFVGMRKRFDLFGVLFLSFVVAVAGGMTRDVLIGAVPPAAITQIHYFLISIAGGLVTFWWYPRVATLKQSILLFDAVGLALFAVTGTQKAIAYGINPLMAAILGMITGIGGGILRDVLAGDVPFVLRADLYAIAALAAGAVVALGHGLGLAPSPSMLLGAALCVFLRLMAMYRGWRAPVARWRGDETP
ncbi:trimeric intracellular cation channel family protein [Acidocella sp. KAb 2-4]|uniref:trimeric intracellular cation channel family protein n=1 Tax=Acidocella sp. KAb 2-4 TaxID=2885158 RepID=UPI001D094EF4|nr:trimeric intracellular cation channel family protein [Acidocella sp. KAb 2-4]MCB5945847.1 trimeric intracellular cation channel family protein [Acidocella sp. KAb 2-4]